MALALVLAYASLGSAAGCGGIWEKDFQRQGLSQGDRRLLDELEESLNQTSMRPLAGRISQGQCPFGIALPGDVTWPVVPEELQSLVEPTTALKLVAVVYSYVPWVPVISLMVEFFAYRGTRQLWILAWLAWLIASNELVVKKLLLEPRPGSFLQLRGEHGLFEGSCVAKCGMPSSHSAIAMGWFVLATLDATFRTQLQRQQREASLQDSSHSESGKALGFLWMCCVVPCVRKEVLTPTEFVSFVAFWFFLMVPVPFMRVVLHDHSCSQVAWGSFMGMVLAVTWWRLVRVLQRRYQHCEGRHVCGGLLRHDYCLPTPEAAGPPQMQLAGLAAVA